MSEKPRDYWSFWAAEALRGGSPLYAHLAEGIGGDPALRALAARAREGQPHPNMLLAAVHFLLLRGAAHPLAQYYPSLGGTRRVAEEDPFPLFRDFVAAHEDAVSALIGSRVTNTNEVGRSALLHPGFRAVAAETGAPLALIEIGPSAGLNLIWDRYGVRYRRNGEVVAETGAGAPLVIDAELRGETLPPLGPAPAIASRLGLELNPNDLSDADNRDWLRALVWPENTERLARLESAMSLFAQAPPDIRQGDALALLLDAIRAVPETVPVCVYHTITLYQFSRRMRAALDDLLTVAGLRRPVWRLGFEFDAAMAGEETGGAANGYVLTVTQYRDGLHEARSLALGHPHGSWVCWLA